MASDSWHMILQDASPDAASSVQLQWILSANFKAASNVAGFSFISSSWIDDDHSPGIKWFLNGSLICSSGHVGVITKLHQLRHVELLQILPTVHQASAVAT